MGITATFARLRSGEQPAEHICEKEPKDNLRKHQYLFYDSQLGLKNLTHKIQDSLKDQLEELVHFIYKLQNENKELHVALPLGQVVAKQSTLEAE